MFPYSARPGTFAGRRKDPVVPAEIKARARRLRELSAARLETAAAAQVGSVKSGLGLRDGRLMTRDYWTVQIDAAVAENSESLVRVTAVEGGTLLRGPALGRLSPALT